MRTPPHPQALRCFCLRSAAAFTLTELLVAMAVLVLLMAVLLQLLSATSESSRIVNQQMDATHEARLVMDMLAADLADAVTVKDSPVLVKDSEPGLAFLTRRRGPSGSATPRFLAVHYTLSGGSLGRAYRAVPWTATDFAKEAFDITDPTSPNYAPVQILSQCVCAWSIAASLADGSSVGLFSSSSSNATQPVPGISGWKSLQTTPTAIRSLQITFAAVDEKTLGRDSGQMAGLRSAFVQPGINESAAQLWTEAIYKGGPASALPSIRVLSKTIDLP